MTTIPAHSFGTGTTSQMLLYTITENHTIEPYCIDCLFFDLIHNLGVDLRGGSFFMPKHLAHGIDVCPVGRCVAIR